MSGAAWISRSSPFILGALVGPGRPLVLWHLDDLIVRARKGAVKARPCPVSLGAYRGVPLPRILRWGFFLSCEYHNKDHRSG